jgi:DNA-binding NarL/FixJ family response regulator
MKKPMNILIVDDHPFIIEAYKNAIKKYSLQGQEFIITQSGNCKAGYENIMQATEPFDIAFAHLLNKLLAA